MVFSFDEVAALAPLSGTGGRLASVTAHREPSESARTTEACIHHRRFDAGVALRDVQEVASHADPRTTMRYDRGRGSLDRHATYVVAAFLAGASR